MRKIILVGVLLFQATFSFSAEIGDTRTTADGVEKCIDVQGKYETWSLIAPSNSWIDKQKAIQNEMENEQLKSQAKADYETSRQAAIDAVISGDDQALTAAKEQMATAQTAIATTELQKATEAKSLPIGTSEITK